MNIVYTGLGILVLLLMLSRITGKKNRKHLQIQVVEANCTGCGRCVKRCRRGVLGTVKTDDGVCAVAKNADKCTACGDCIGKCKFNALKFVVDVENVWRPAGKR